MAQVRVEVSGRASRREGEGAHGERLVQSGSHRKLNREAQASLGLQGRVTPSWGTHLLPRRMPSGGPRYVDATSSKGRTEPSVVHAVPLRGA